MFWVQKYRFMGLGLKTKLRYSNFMVKVTFKFRNREDSFTFIISKHIQYWDNSSINTFIYLQM